jgi:uncharacterized protein with PIN domain
MDDLRDDLRDEAGDELNAEANPAQIDETFNLFGSTQDVVQKYTHCVMCGANLHFTHLTDFNRNLTEETSRCPECGVKSRRTMHRLQ